MTSDALNLLKMLEPAVRPLGAPPARGGAGSAPVEHEPFAALLARAAAGGVASERAVSVAPSLALEEPLEPDVLRKVAAAADRAEAAGSTRPLVLVDGRAFVVDLATREITAEVSAAHGNAATPVDAAIVADDAAPSGGPLRPPALTNFNLATGIAGD